jgi:outer membrane lipoprotein-sorting protein
MRRFLIPALMISLLLGGCGGAAAAERKIEEQRDALAAADQFRFTAALTESRGDEVFCCTLECSSAPGETAVTVTAPETVAGVTARIADGETAVAYDGVRLSVGTAGETGLHPISAMARLCGALRAGHVVRAWTERDGDAALLAAELFLDGDVGLTVWFRADTLAPCAAEFSEDGTLVLRCEITDFQIT